MLSKPKIAIVGLGNLLLGDEGFGIHVVRYLEKHYLFPEECELIDGGCLGLKLLDLLREKDIVFLIDVFLDPNEVAGRLYTFQWEEIEKFSPQRFVSAHQIGVQEALALARFQGLRPSLFKVFATIPLEISPGIRLSPPLRELLPKVSEQLLSELKQKGVSIQKKS